MSLFVMYGKIVEVVKNDDPSKCLIIVELEKDYRESNGIYSNQLFEVFIWRGLCDMLLDNKSIGEMILMKGRIEMLKGKSVLIAEHVKIIHP